MKIPVIGPENVRQMSTDSPNAMQTPQSADNSGANMQVVGGAVEDVGSRVQKAASYVEELKAQNTLESTLTSIKEEASKNADYSEKATLGYHAQIQQAITDSAKGISFPGGRSNYVNAQNTKAQIDIAQINAIQNTKMVKDLKAQVALRGVTLGQDFLNAQSTPAFAKALGDLHDTIQDAHTHGLYGSRDEAQVAENKIITGWKEDHLKTWTESNPQWVLDQIKLGKDGFYSSFPKEKLDAAKFVAERNVRTLARQARFDGTKEAMTLKAQGKFTLSMAQDMHSAGLISDAFMAGEIQNAKLKDVKEQIYLDPKTDPKIYDTFVQKLIDPSLSSAEQDKVLGDAIAAEKEGTVTLKDLMRLYEAHIIPPTGKRANSYYDLKTLEQALGNGTPNTQQLSDLHTAQDKAHVEDKTWWQKTFEKVMDWNTRMTIRDKVVNEGLSGVDMLKAAKEEELKSFLKRNPRFLNAPPAGIDYQDAKGRWWTGYSNRLPELKHGK